MDELLKRDKTVRFVNHSRNAEVPHEVTVIAADMSDQNKAPQTCQGVDVVYLCAAPPYRKWADHFPPLTRKIMAGAKNTGPLLDFSDNVYAYGPTPQPMHEDLPLRERGPLTNTHKKMQEMLMDAHKTGELEVVIFKASDYYGPSATSSHMSDWVFPN